MKSGPAEGRKQTLGRVPTALREWATSGHCTGPSRGSLPRVSLKGGSREVVPGVGGLLTQPLCCLVPDTCKAASGASGLNLEPGPAGTHTCPPSAAGALGEAWGQGRLACFQRFCQQERREAGGPAKRNGIWSHQEEKESWAGLGWRSTSYRGSGNKSRKSDVSKLKMP